jgi:Zinc finger, C3HC4 type (RING finger)
MSWIRKREIYSKWNNYYAELDPSESSIPSNMGAFDACFGFFSGKSKDSNTRVPPPPAQVDVRCLSCNAPQTVTPPAFVCRICNILNRINGDCPSDNPEESMNLRRMGSSIFQISNERILPIGTPAEFRIPSCSVCLDGIGDIVFLPCLHGGFCEDCARQVASNSAVGGAHCPRCRVSIEGVYRMREVLGGNLVKCVNLDIKIGGGKKSPPKVPPPPGSRKKQSASTTSTQQQ